jgi:hypothetical protein
MNMDGRLSAEAMSKIDACLNDMSSETRARMNALVTLRNRMVDAGYTSWSVFCGKDDLMEQYDAEFNNIFPSELMERMNTDTDVLVDVYALHDMFFLILDIAGKRFGKITKWKPFFSAKYIYRSQVYYDPPYAKYFNTEGIELGRKLNAALVNETKWKEFASKHANYPELIFKALKATNPGQALSSTGW